MATVGTLTGGAIKTDTHGWSGCWRASHPFVTLRCGPQMSSYIVLFFTIFISAIGVLVCKECSLPHFSHFLLWLYYWPSICFDDWNSSKGHFLLSSLFFIEPGNDFKEILLFNYLPLLNMTMNYLLLFTRPTFYRHMRRANS